VVGFYEAHGLEVRIAAQNTGAAIFDVGFTNGTDSFQDNKFQVDLTTTYQMTKHLQAYFQAKNLTNGPLRFYSGFQNRPFQREIYDASYEGGVRFTF